MVIDFADVDPLCRQPKTDWIGVDEAHGVLDSKCEHDSRVILTLSNWIPLVISGYSNLESE